jgi:lipoate-protein ligase A
MPTLVTPTLNLAWRNVKVGYPSAFMNLAVEEAMARVFSAGIQTQPTIRVWSNPKAVVVGRFQEATTEVDLTLCGLSHVQVVRRFTGGGSVFHDEGTLNLTLVDRHSTEVSILGLHQNNLWLVTEALADLGLRSSVALPNSILIDGRKVCGAAAAVGRHFTLWHCSILVNTDTKLLELVLAPSRSTAPSRFVRSKWRPVTTLAKALSKPISVDEVARNLERSLEKSWGAQLEAKPLSAEEKRFSEALYAERYSRDEWNLKGERGIVWDEERERITQQLRCEFAQRP